MATILITGGTGLIGQALAKALAERGDTVIILTRSLNHKQTGNRQIKYAQWDVATQIADKNAISESDYIIHLAGAGVADKRWTAKRKQEIIDSRVKSGELIVKALSEIPNKVKAVISISGIGWYLTPGPSAGGEGRDFFREDDQPGNDFLAQTCVQWESAIEPVKENKRLVIFRTGPVLAKEGGMLKEFIKPLRFGIAPILGNGRQVISWIHMDDVVRMFMMAIENEKIAGVYNAVAPQPVTNKQLVLQLARARNKFYIPVYVPSFVLKMMLGEMSVEVLKSVRVSSEKIEQAGFVFNYPGLQSLDEYFAAT